MKKIHAPAGSKRVSMCGKWDVETTQDDEKVTCQKCQKALTRYYAIHPKH